MHLIPGVYVVARSHVLSDGAVYERKANLATIALNIRSTVAIYICPQTPTVLRKGSNLDDLGTIALTIRSRVARCDVLFAPNIITNNT